MSTEQNNPTAETPKIKVIGRIGQEATFKTIPDKQDLFIGNLSVAEHPDRDKTVWHDVAIFGDRARRLQEQFTNGELRVGQEVEVVGTVHRRERPTKDGGTMTVEQIYAYSVKPLTREVKTEEKPEVGAEDVAQQPTEPTNSDKPMDSINLPPNLSDPTEEF